MKPLHVVSSLALIAALPAQTTHLVGPIGFAQISHAIDVASPGDTVLVAPGTYAQFKLNKGITIRAITPGTVTVAYNPAFSTIFGCPLLSLCLSTEVTEFSVPTGQAAHVVGLRFADSVVTPFVVLRVRVVGGCTTFDSCEFRGASSALETTGARVHLQQCSIASTSAGGPLTASNSVITAVDCVITGSTVTTSSTVPFAAVYIDNSTLHGSNVSLAGPTAAAGGQALRTTGSSAVWLADSSLTGGTGSCAVNASATTTLNLDRCTIVDNTAGCAVPPASSLVLGVQRSSPPQNGALFTLVHRTEPNGFVAVFASPGLVNLNVPGVEPRVYLDLGAMFPAGVYFADAFGVANASWTMPAGSQWVGTTIWLQGVTGFTGPLKSGPVVGGVIQ